MLLSYCCLALFIKKKKKSVKDGMDFSLSFGRFQDAFKQIIEVITHVTDADKTCWVEMYLFSCFPVLLSSQQ